MPESHAEIYHSLLIETKLGFLQWRRNRGLAGASTPKSLRRKAVELLDFYPLNTVVSELGLNSTALKSWQPDPEPCVEIDGFIELPTLIAAPETSDLQIEEVPSSKPTSNISLQLSLNNGHQLQFSGDISPALLTALMAGIQQNGVTA